MVPAAGGEGEEKHERSGILHGVLKMAGCERRR